ncbi:Catechol 2,3-dioxygenase [Enhydrobacter aerosaccus]|uniref:Catechol 2,3-dioxygenase n=1 Tax=Enhydrobacter aerosaccus TaxID=225324 RepID=A0A1T4KFX6_9HYPH|nr:VOC family protein [Enhydrobacter aerosaccus]SJZ41275.1 Catechol 2,3-dioxygenase [Enhydrobacter aerosaccus]
MDTIQRTSTYDIGGIRYPQPFKIRRLGHFGFNVPDLDAGLDFYAGLLGFRITDTRDFSKIAGREEMAKRMQDTRIVFMSHNTDHHAFLLAHKSMGAIFGDDAVSKDVTVNQITWQVGTMEEVFAAADYFRDKQVEIRRVGRDMPGSNWHTYIRDPDGHTVELYYGMEQIGWDGRSKPEAMYYRAFRERPELPQISEETEVREAIAKGVDINAGNTIRDRSDEEYVVAGVKLPRPFKIVNIGPMSLFVADVGASEAFYTKTMGFVRTEVVTYKGHRCVYLRNGSEHHSLSLMPKALRAELGLNPNTSVASMGLQVGSYRQLRDAVAFLKKKGVQFTEAIPADLHPGVDYAAHIVDPAGHTLMLYYYMERVGWDGQPRPAAQRRPVAKEWPESLEPMSDTYADPVFMGPIG